DDCKTEGPEFGPPWRRSPGCDHRCPPMRLSGALIERLAERDIALLLLSPVAAAGDGDVDPQIVAVDEAGFVTGEKHRSLRDILGQSGARYRLRDLVDLAHHIGCL